MSTVAPDASVSRRVSRTLPLVVRNLGRRDYMPVWRAMSEFTDRRDRDTPDELWLVEHPPVYTLGQAGEARHVLAPGDIPVIHVDRGGQVTYHGPGQVVAYPLINLRRRGIGIRRLVHALEAAVVEQLAGYGVAAETRAGAPGVYVDGRKIAALGLRVRRGCTFHGLAFNVDMDLTPFDRINPCGFEQMEITQVRAAGGPGDWERVAADLTASVTRVLGYRLVADRGGMKSIVPQGETPAGCPLSQLPQPLTHEPS